MGNRTISLHQLLAVLFAALFPLCTEGLPGRAAGAGGAAWLCPLAAGAAAVGVLALLTRKPLLGQGSLTQGGGWWRRALAGAYLL